MGNELTPKQVQDQNLPEAIESEQVVLGVCCQHGVALDMIEFLQPEDFFLPLHADILRSMRGMRERGIHLDPVTIVEHCKPAEELGGMAYLVALMNREETIFSIESHAKIVQEKAKLRRIIGKLSEVQQIAYLQSYEKALSATDEFLSELEPAGNEEFVPLRDSLVRVKERGDEIRNNPEELLGIESGMGDIDTMMSGLQKEDLIVIAGGTSAGKSCVAHNIALSVAKQGLGVGIISLEMSEQQVAQRMVTIHTQIEYQKIRNWKLLNDTEYERVHEGMKYLDTLPLYTDDTTSMTPAEAHGRARRLKRESGIELLIVDYLQLFPEGRGNEVQELSSISRGFKILADDLDIPILLLSQLNRGPNQHADGEPQLGHLRGSGGIENSADCVWLIWRPGQYDPESDEKNITHINVAKQRNGPTGPVSFFFAADTLTLFPLAEGMPF